MILLVESSMGFLHQDALQKIVFFYVEEKVTENAKPTIV
jgi:hypothetical protein